MSDMIESFEPPASSQDIDSLLNRLGHPLPDAYVSFLKQSNGYERCRFEPVHFWATHELQGKNEAYQIQKYMPNFFAIGTSGGDMAFLFERSASADVNEWPIIVTDLGSLSADYFFGSVGTFTLWQQNNFVYEYLFRR